jgi:hypothetical protein
MTNVKRCKRCKCLAEESSFKYFQRIKTGLDFFCRKCFKKQDIPYEVPKKKIKVDLIDKERVLLKIIKKRNRGLDLNPDEITIWSRYLRKGVI